MLPIAIPPGSILPFPEIGELCVGHVIEENHFVLVGETGCTIKPP